MAEFASAAYLNLVTAACNSIGDNIISIAYVEDAYFSMRARTQAWLMRESREHPALALLLYQ